LDLHPSERDSHECVVSEGDGGFFKILQGRVIETK